MSENKVGETAFTFNSKLIETIHTSYKWIKVKRYATSFEDLKADPNTNWKLEYEMLMEHHNKETNFLIDYIRDLFKDSEEIKKDEK